MNKVLVVLNSQLLRHHNKHGGRRRLAEEERRAFLPAVRQTLSHSFSFGSGRGFCVGFGMDAACFPEEVSERKVCVVGSELVESYTVRPGSFRFSFRAAAAEPHTSASGGVSPAQQPHISTAAAATRCSVTPRQFTSYLPANGFLCVCINATGQANSANQGPLSFYGIFSEYKEVTTQSSFF